MMLLKKRFEIYQQAKSEKEKRHVELGEGISVVRDMFVADSMEEAKEPNREVKPISADGTTFSGRVCRRLYLIKTNPFY